MPSQWKFVSTLVANALLGAAILVFAIGFFPHKAVLPGLAEWDNEHHSHRISAPFDRVIFMVVDALRSDFVYGNTSHFSFTQSLIRSGAAVPFTGHASPPTITMPRVKAITTGSVPSFIDLVLNFAESDTTSTLATQDSWLAQLKSQPGKKLVMYGDDTWLRLFPDFFERADGTTSFFVSDFTEVDLNVTRHVPIELQQDDWSAMIMHYLGLDHIGHKTGPLGPNMPGKQREMDDIVRDIYTAMEQYRHLQSAVLVLLGDHGMNDAGNHGANSAGETSTALTFISPKFKSAFRGLPCPQLDVSNFEFYDVVEQSDIAPTLASFLGFPVPKNSLGIIIPKLLNLWTSPRDRFDMVFANAEQVQRIAAATYPEFFSSDGLSRCAPNARLSDAHELACSWSSIVQAREAVHNKKTDTDEALQQVLIFLKRAQSVLSGAASKYDLSKMTTGIGLVLCSFITVIVANAPHIIRSGVSGLVFSLNVVLYAVTMFASSYVEEEHQFWYWFTAAWLTLLACKSRRQLTSTYTGSLLVCIGYGVARRWNQTGQKYAGDPDLVTQILSRRPWLLWTLVVFTYALLSRRLSRRASSWGGTKQLAILPVLITISAFLFKVAFTSADAPELLEGLEVFDPVVAFTTRYPLVSLARIVFIGLGHLVVTALFYDLPWQSPQRRQAFLSTFHDVLSLFLVTQTRTVNVPLFLIYHFQFQHLFSSSSTSPLSPLEITTTTLLLQHSSFFAQGGTNAISSIDLSNAYNGVSGYNVLAVGFLTFVSNWAGPVYWTSAAACLLHSHQQSRGSGWVDHFGARTVFVSGAAAAVMVACTVLREHLFIWTVFSPKYLYTAAWVFLQHFLVDGVLGRFLLGS